MECRKCACLDQDSQRQRFSKGNRSRLATQPGLCIVYKPSGWVPTSGSRLSTWPRCQADVRARTNMLPEVVNVNSDTAAGLGMGQQVDGAVSSTRPRHTLLCVCFFYGWSPPNGFPLGFLQNQTTIWVPHTASNTALSPRWQGGEDTWEGDQALPGSSSMNCAVQVALVS